MPQSTTPLVPYIPSPLRLSSGKGGGTLVTISTGVGVPVGTQPRGSIYIRADGTPGNILYYSNGDGTWFTVPVGGVTSVSAVAPLISSGGLTPLISLLTPLDIIYGGTGSTQKVWVDLTSAQTVGGPKTFTGDGAFTGGLTIGTPLGIPSGGTGTASPGDVAGTGVAITGSFPTETIALGGANPLTAGSNVTFSGVWPNITISASAGSPASPVVITATEDTQVPLTLNGTDVRQTADLLDLFDYVGHTKVAWFDSAGALHLNTPLAILQGGTGTTTPALVAGTGITITGAWPNSTVGLVVPVAISSGGTGSTTQNFVDLTTAQTAAGAKTWSGAAAFNTSIVDTAGAIGTVPLTVRGFSASQTADIFVASKNSGGTQLFAVVPQTTGGNLTGTHSGTAVSGNFAPAYTVAGVALGATAHMAQGTVNILAAATATVTLTAPAAFTSGTSYSVNVSSDAAANLGAYNAFAQTATTFKITNPDGAAAHNFQWFALGT